AEHPLRHAVQARTAGGQVASGRGGQRAPDGQFRDLVVDPETDADGAWPRVLENVRRRFAHDPCEGDLRHARYPLVVEVSGDVHDVSGRLDLRAGHFDGFAEIAGLHPAGAWLVVVELDDEAEVCHRLACGDADRLL